MDDYRNCRECRRIFRYPGFGDILCPLCRKQDDEDFEKVKKYLQEHVGAKGKDVFKATGVTVQKIQKWLREERLIVSDATGLGLTCESCGAIISSGKLCPDCKRALAVGFGFGRDTGKQPETNRPTISRKDQKMRFLGNG